MNASEHFLTGVASAKHFVPAFALSLALGGIPQATAHPFTIGPSKDITNSTIVRVGIDLTKPGTGPGGLFSQDHFSISYTDYNTKLPVTKFATADLLTGSTAVDIQAVPGTVTVKNLDEAVPNQTAQVNIFDPPSNVVVSAFKINPGSNLVLGGNTLALSGGFSAVQTTVDYDPASPTYGVETGYIDAISIQASGAPGTAILHVAPTTTQTSLAGVWSQLLPLTGPYPAGGVSAPDAFSFSGMLEFNSSMTPFDATFDGTITFLEDGSTTALGTLAMSTSFGSVTGTLSASAFPQLVPEPETGSLDLLGLGLIGLVLRGRQVFRAQGGKHPSRLAARAA